jgi:nucleoside-diphosphate-sugar epimerase
MSASKCIAITGASGYVGAALACALESAGHKVIKLGRVQSDSELSLNWNLADSQDLADPLRRRNTEVLVHCAYDFTTHGPRGERLNIEGSGRLLDSFRRSGGQTAILISTMSAFVNTRSQYGIVKCAIERLFSQKNEYSLRLGLIFGNNPRGMVGALVKVTSILRFAIPMIGSGRYRLHTLHIDDLCIAVQRLIEAPEISDAHFEAGSILTIADPASIEFRDIVGLLAHARGLKPKLIPIPWRLVWLVLKFAESLGIRGRLRADGIIGLVYSDPAPNIDASVLRRLGLNEPRSLRSLAAGTS